MPALLIQSGSLKGQKLVLPKETDRDVVIGRDRGCDIQLTLGEISRKHCMIRMTRDGLFVRDLGSANKTFLNERAIDGEVRMKPGDHLRVGSMIFEIMSGLSESSIVFWLGDEDDDASSTSDDTTIVKGRPQTVASGNRSAERTASKLPKKTTNISSRKKIKSIAEQGNEIIHEYLESIKESQ